MITRLDPKTGAVLPNPTRAVHEYQDKVGNTTRRITQLKEQLKAKEGDAKLQEQLTKAEEEQKTLGASKPAGDIAPFVGGGSRGHRAGELGRQPFDRISQRQHAAQGQIDEELVLGDVQPGDLLGAEQRRAAPEPGRQALRPPGRGL